MAGAGGRWRSLVFPPFFCVAQKLVVLVPCCHWRLGPLWTTDCSSRHSLLWVPKTDKRFPPNSLHLSTSPPQHPVASSPPIPPLQQGLHLLSLWALKGRVVESTISIALPLPLLALAHSGTSALDSGSHKECPLAAPASCLVSQHSQAVRSRSRKMVPTCYCHCS